MNGFISVVVGHLQEGARTLQGAGLTPDFRLGEEAFHEELGFEQDACTCPRWGGVFPADGVAPGDPDA